MEELRRIRKERGLSQAKLAARAGLDPATVNQIELGKRKPTTSSLEKLAEALDVELAELFKGYAMPPKAQAPLWSGEGPGRRPSVFAQAIAVAADKWTADVPRDDVADGEIAGRVEAALDLYEFFAESIKDEERNALERDELDELVAVTDKLARAGADGLLRLHKSGYLALDDHAGEAFEERREKMKEWTRQISA